MNSILKLSFAAALCVSAFATAAHAESIDVRVIGTITPPSCTPTLTGGGIVDYGKILSSKLSMTAYNRLSTKDVPFSIVCTGPARIAVRATDNRSSSQIAGILTTSGSGVGIADASNYGLGKAGTADIGGYAIRLLQGSFTVDGNSRFTVSSLNNGTTWSDSLSGVLVHGTTALTSWSTKSGGVPAAFKNLAGTLQVEAVLNRGSALPLGSQIDLDGSATLELVYL